MNLSKKGLDALKHLEGAVIVNNRHVIYDDKTGQPIARGIKLPRGATIGYGHLIKPGEDFASGITDEYATELLSRDVAVAESVVNQVIVAPLNQNQFDALVIFAYNIGVNNFKNSSVVKFINNPNYQSGQFTDLQSAWRAWNRSGGRVVPGLVRRRNYEVELFFNSVL